MITPKAFRYIIQHFDGIDKVVSARSLRKRPWSEIALTSLLCDLMDEETQGEESISYTFKNLQEDLSNEDSLFGINISLETIEFNPIYERYISQSDIGLKLIYDNQIEPEYSWTKPYLLQAKKLFPKRVNPLSYTETSRYTSIDKDQQNRIELLNKILGAPYLKYLLFSPRPDGLEDQVKIKLAYLQSKTLSTQIFDYIRGLEIHKELLNSSNTLKAGVFITNTDTSNLNFGQVHEGILQNTFPLSWFIAMNFLDSYDFFQGEVNRRGKMEHSDTEDKHELVEGILKGDNRKINELIEKIEEVKIDDFPTNIQVLPKHTINLKISVGEQIDSNNRILRRQ